MRHALQKEHELQNLDALSHRPVALIKSEGSETAGVRISTVALPGRTKWSPPHDGRDRLVVMLGQTDQLLERDCDTAVPSRWAWVPANSNCKVANAGEQTRNLMIIEFNDVTVKEGTDRMNSAAKMNGGPFPEQHETRMKRRLAHKWREMFQRRRRMSDPLLVFNMSIFNFDHGWNRIFTQFKIHENGT